MVETAMIGVATGKKVKDQICCSLMKLSLLLQSRTGFASEATDKATLDMNAPLIEDTRC